MEQAQIDLAHGLGGVGRAPGGRHDPSLGAQAGSDQADSGARVNERAEYQSSLVQVHRSAAAANRSPANQNNFTNTYV